MLLYNESFPLKKGLRFSSYVKKLDELAFPPYTLLIEKTDESDIVNIEILVDSIFTGFHSFASGGMLINKCAIQYYKEERSFIISGSISNWNLIMPIFYLGMAVFFILFLAFLSITRGIGVSIETILIILAIVLMFVSPYIAMYSNERKLLNRIGQIGAE